jgi:VCBS repeat protein/HYDIN/CFA65/VesB family protein/FG-GAP repeat protein
MTTKLLRGILANFVPAIAIVLAVFCVLAPTATAQNYMFNRADYATGAGPRTIAVGDFNGDGKMDVVVGDTSDPSHIVSVLLGKRDGTFKPALNHTVESNPTAVAMGDFNNDGKLDIVVVSGFQSSAGISVLLGNGDGTFKPFVFFSAGQAPTSIAVGDFNGDKNLDIALSDNETGVNGVDILLGNGNGTFQASVLYPTAADPRMVVVADLNKDGKLDLVTVNSGTQTVSTLLGNGDGTFQTHQDFATQAGCVSLATGDLRNAAKVDIVAGCQVNGQVAVLLSNGDGTFKKAKNYSVPGGVDIVAVGDFNGDGKQDVAVTNGSTAGLVSVLPGKGTGTLAAAVAFGTDFGPEGLAAADFNGDGVLDLAIANNATSINGTGGSISVLLSNGKSLFSGRSDYNVSSSSTSGAYGGIAAADFTGDGKPDLVLGITPASTISVLLNKGNGTFNAFKEYSVPGGPQAMVTGDFNNDHKNDIAASIGGSTVAVLLNNGNGTFATPAGSYPISSYGYGIAVGDFNKDGNLDIVATNLTNNTVSVLMGTGAGGFQNFVTYPTGNFPYGVSVGDFNHDGWLDLAVANQRDGTVSILLNKADGSGTFLPKKDFTVGGSPNFVAVGSFRGNGTLDLAVATNNAFGGIQVLLGNNDGTFQPAVAYSTLNNAYAVTAGDFNHDGKLDLAVGINNGIFPGFVTVLLGKGDGTFPTELSFLTGTVPFGIVAADFNKDGVLDLATNDGTTQGGDIGAATVLLNYAVVSLAPTTLAFGSQKVGTTSHAKKVTISNPGAAPLHIVSIAATGDFAETNNCPASLVTGKSCTIRVIFKPTQKGKRTGDVTIKDTARTSPQAITLAGTGT